MASKRMFSNDITDSDKFLDLPFNSQLLYFHLGMHGDVKGFVQPKRVTRSVGLKIEDLKPLIEEGFVIPFESGVVVITHWNINNQTREDREASTRFIKELAQLSRDDGVYMLIQENSGSTTGELPHSIDKIRLNKVRLKESMEDEPTLKEIKFSKREEITESVLQELSEKYGVPVDFVADCWDTAQNWLDSKGVRKQNYKSFLANWVKRERATYLLKARQFSSTKGGVVDARVN